MKEFSFLVVAGGSGSRIGGLEKQFRSLGDGPLWLWSVRLAESLKNEGVSEIVLVLPEGRHIENFPSFSLPFRVASGGATRSESVRNGLSLCSCDYVMVHDAARPFASPGLLADLMERTGETTGAVPVLPLTEAVKRIENGKITVVPRENLYGTQTPQSFFRSALERVLEEHGAGVRDEAEAWLAAGLELQCVEGERLNFKVTWPEDLRLASLLAADMVRNARNEREMENETGFANEIRTGIGYDVHRLTPERPLILGGVRIESPLGLLGHSDADLLAHTVSDAILGAAGLPDIGNLFPADDEKYRGADSMKLLGEVVEKVKGEGWSIVWVDAVIEAQIPRLNAHLPLMREKLSAFLNPQGENCVNLKAKSAEKTGDPGLGRSMVCRAVATLRRSRVK
ncbi:MAG: 2-C-methyl-D-erythritol 2,4-cyclodiphosphate synthase [Synergistaceae bacterium]|jgi:2-C-methyl-D-erythritol 4-phosphate cytidylyltransferase/2-C-methyl-D-erythritol 2,4-cyclodiphosphate synthase|nr:2-C-methyl-D-erythritol 2,4-cyclodiphosphate synthase [Synergistaceae bacterium]